MFFFIFFDISSLLLRYITPAIPRSSRLDLSKNILKNIDSYLNFRTLEYWTKRNKSTRYPKKLIQIIADCTNQIAEYPYLYKKADFKDTRVASLGNYSIFYKATWFHADKEGTSGM